MQFALYPEGAARAVIAGEALLKFERASPEREHASSQPIRDGFATETQPPALLTGLQGRGFKRLAKALGVARP
jgi:hypothetical protein